MTYQIPNITPPPQAQEETLLSTRLTQISHPPVSEAIKLQPLSPPTTVAQGVVVRTSPVRSPELPESPPATGGRFSSPNSDQSGYSPTGLLEKAAPSLFSLASYHTQHQSKFPAAASAVTLGTRPAQRTTIDLLIQLFPELPQQRLQMIAQTYGENKIMAIENALALRRAQHYLTLSLTQEETSPYSAALAAAAAATTLPATTKPTPVTAAASFLGQQRDLVLKQLLSQQQETLAGTDRIRKFWSLIG
eukprot:sb/3468834/